MHVETARAITKRAASRYLKAPRGANRVVMIAILMNHKCLATRWPKRGEESAFLSLYASYLSRIGTGYLVERFSVRAGLGDLITHVLLCEWFPDLVNLSRVDVLAISRHRLCDAS
jgi:hypothetical protein